MTAREYLGQLRALDVKIRQKREQAQELRAMAYSGGSIACDTEKVQTSPSQTPRQMALMEELVDLLAEVESKTAKYIELKDRIINQIQSMDNVRYMQLLFKRYVEYKSLGRIAAEMGYSVSHVEKLHGWALKDFAYRAGENRCLRKSI